MQLSRTFRGTFTACEVAENSREFAADFVWMHAQGRVFRVPRAWVQQEHPGGEAAILGVAGTDAGEDFAFHSRSAQEKWAAFEVGTLVPCPALPLCAIA